MRVIVIPVYNEECTVGAILNSVREFCDIVVVVNDCSTDSTFDICSGFDYVHIITNTSNLGYDYSIIKGLDYSFRLNASSILTIDADGQHPVHEIPKLFDCIENQGYSIAIGSRSKLPRMSEYLFSFYTYIFFGVWDITSGFKCYDSNVIGSNSFPSYSSVGTYFTIKCLIDGLHVKSLPICIRERVGSLSRFGLNYSADKKILVALCNAISLHLRTFLSISSFR